MIESLDYSADGFEDIVAKDKRYDARAYTLLTDVTNCLMKDGGHASGEAILEEFRDRAIELFGPLAYTVLTEWGVKGCRDIGEMMMNLADSKRIARDEDDSLECFAEGYDFVEAFQNPFLP